MQVDPLLYELHQALILKKKKLALAESCTGGALSERIISLPGASTFFLGSLVVYDNAWKEQFLGVSHQTMQKYGAVSEEVVKEMVQGIFHQTKADVAVAVSGIAGPTGGSEDKPVGTIFIAVGERKGAIDLQRIHAPSPRKNAIACAVQAALEMLLRRVTIR
jgi:PncC family amidohydrolase